jgi:hypothetical protein
MAKSTGEPKSGYQKLGELHVIGRAAVDADCCEYERAAYAAQQERHEYTVEIDSKEPTVKGYTKVG